MKYPIFICGFILCFGSCDFSHRNVEHVSVKGSDTEVNLVLAMAERFMELDPEISIAVTGGGSGAGISALINDKTDIANSSRPMKAAEIRLAEERSIDPRALAFAIDALVLIVHESQKVEALSLDQLAQIYRGEVDNWREVGGEDVPVSLYGRQSNSGTFIYFRDEVVRAEYSGAVKQMNGTAQIVEAIRTDPAGIGYVGLGYVLDQEGKSPSGLKILSISGPDGVVVSPAREENIRSGVYPILRPLYQYTNGIPEGKLRTFLEFIWSLEGQRLVEENGYYSLPTNMLEENYLLIKDSEI